MSDYTKKEIALVLQTAELLNKKQSAEHINVSQFCKEVGISRKNAYKHKNNIDFSEEASQARVSELEKAKSEIEHKLELAEARIQDVDLKDELIGFLREYNLNKKNPKRQRELIESYNKLAASHGLTCLDFPD